jgi:hypothetical protein
MKRKAISVRSPPAKRQRMKDDAQDPVEAALTDAKSVREQAKPYHLCTAKFPLEALTPSWSIGSNRTVDVKHVQDLCRIFEENGVQRECAENHLLLACTQAAVQKMMDHTKSSASGVSGLEDRAGNNLEPWLSFEEWMSVNGSKAEIMAGQHRVEALKMFLERKGNEAVRKEQSWWICDIYDGGRLDFYHYTSTFYGLANTLLDNLPPRLNIGLRANRHDYTLPDSHGQVWMELVTLAKADSSLFQGSSSEVQKEMLAVLGLSGRVKFPIRRLATLWKNSTWLPMITRWCSTAIGRSTFNLSMWEEMARYRIDDVS